VISTRLAAFFDIVAQDPVVSRVKLIGEPWDIGQRDSYSAGRFHRCGAVPRRNRYLADPGYTVWYTPSGRPMTLRDWQSSSRKSIAIYIDGTVAPDLGAHGQPMLDDDVLILVNGSPRPVNFTFPQAGKQCSWHAEADSFDLPTETASRQPARAIDATGAASRGTGRRG
jgi:pullulanase/glycogen debranching enzyme